MPDKDTERFIQQGLGQTGPGLLLRMAMHDGRIAASQIKRLRQLGGSRGVLISIETWRRSYIKSCATAAQAIDVLWETYGWPADGARARDYEWRPREDYQRWLAAHSRLQRDFKRPK